MSYFRSLDKVVSSQLFTKPNSLLLPNCYRPVYLESNTEPNIHYLHSLKSLLVTIEQLKAAQGNATYSELIRKQLSFLNHQRELYFRNISTYVYKGGLLTGEGIANIYYSANSLNLSAEWLQQKVHHQIPAKIKYMSRTNLIDTLNSLKKIHPASPYITSVQQQLSKRSIEEYVIVEHQNNSTSKFEYTDADQSNNVLLRAVQSNCGLWKYFLWLQMNRFYNKGRYTLHNA